MQPTLDKVNGSNLIDNWQFFLKLTSPSGDKNDSTDYYCPQIDTDEHRKPPTPPKGGDLRPLTFDQNETSLARYE